MYTLLHFMFWDNNIFMISEANILPQPQWSVVSLKDQKRFWKNGKLLSYQMLMLHD